LSVRLRVGVVGTGSLGRHHVRILSELPGADLVGICDARPEVARALGEQHGAPVFDEIEPLLRAAEAIVVAVPTADHAEVARRALAAGCHVLVEKPIAPDLASADAILEAARDRVLAVGHVEFFNPAVQELLRRQEQPRFIEVERLAPFSPRSLDIDVILDLMIHDLQIMHALDGSPILEIRATGIDVLSPRVDIATARIELASGCVVHLTASRVSDSKVRRLRVFFEHSYFSVDYTDQAIKGFRLATEPGSELRRIVPVEVTVERAEPLRCELLGFLARCRGEAAPIVDGRAGRRALESALAVARAVGARSEQEAG
jgi:predicted dehydrogenase